MARWRSLLAAAAGAAAAFLFDPDRGKARRARLRDQMAASARQVSQAVERRAAYERGRLRGLLHEARHRGEDMPRDDDELLHKIMSEALGPVGVVDTVEVLVHNGEVVVRGAIEDQAVQRDVVRRIEAITGVRAVRNEM